MNNLLKQMIIISSVMIQLYFSNVKNLLELVENVKKLLLGIRNYIINYTIKYQKSFFFFLNERKMKIYEFRDYSKINSSFTVNK